MSWISLSRKSPDIDAINDIVKSANPEKDTNGEFFVDIPVLELFNKVTRLWDTLKAIIGNDVIPEIQIDIKETTFRFILDTRHKITNIIKCKPQQKNPEAHKQYFWSFHNPQGIKDFFNDTSDAWRIVWLFLEKINSASQESEVSLSLEDMLSAFDDKMHYQTLMMRIRYISDRLLHRQRSESITITKVQPGRISPEDTVTLKLR